MTGPNFLKYFDSSGRTPRPAQVQALEWMSTNWDTRVLALNAPVGAGKSAISKAIADITGAHVITPSNVLVDQYSATYPSHNYLKGKSHYACKGVKGISCLEWTELSEQPPCPGCPYDACKQRAFKEPTFFNPMSLYFLSLQRQWNAPTTLIVDEAHTLAGMILNLCGLRLRKSEYKFSEAHTNEVAIVPWLVEQLRKLDALLRYYKADVKRSMEILSEQNALKLTLKGLQEDAHNYAIWIERGTYRSRPEMYLNVKPIVPPKFAADKLLDAKRIILMSGTLFDTDIKDLVGPKGFEFLDLPSPIPAEQRSIRYAPVSFPMNKYTDPKDLAHEIEDLVKRYPTHNAIVHVTYALSRKLVPHFTIPIIYNTQRDKDEKLDEFKKRGGVFIAAGCAEGIDLPGDLCRLNIIPKLPFPDLSDPIVQKRKATEGGDIWYALQTFKTLIQQAGRSTRGADDWSLTYVMDPNFPRVFRQIKDKLPRSFVEAIKWSE